MFPPLPREGKKRKKPIVRKNHKRRRRNSRLGLVGLILAISVVLGLGVWWIIAATSDAIDPKELRFTADMSYHATTDSIYYVSEQKLNCIDYANNEKWSVELPFAQAKTKASAALASVYNDNIVVVYTNTGDPLFTKEFYGKIKGVQCGENYVAVLNEDASGTSKIVMLNTKGEEVTKV